jgi:hypothetical protein
VGDCFCKPVCLFDEKYFFKKINYFLIFDNVIKNKLKNKINIKVNIKIKFLEMKLKNKYLK